MASEYKLKGLTSVDLKNGQKAEYVFMCFSPSFDSN